MALKLDSQVRQEQIAHAALAVVAQHGLKRLNIASVARRVGVVPSALYRHFKSKDAILDTVMGLVRERLLENVRVVTGTVSDPLEQLRVLLARHVQFIKENQALPRVVFSEEVYDGRPGRRRAMFRTIQTYLDRVADIVRDGQAKGLVRKDLDPGTVAVMFLGLIQPAAVLWQMSEGEFDVTAHAERAWKVFVEAIRA
jgi:TetR/AcrR family transcriptional regulator, fatty acid metabolism regulator protein